MRVDRGRGGEEGYRPRPSPGSPLVVPPLASLGYAEEFPPPTLFSGYYGAKLESRGRKMDKKGKRTFEDQEWFQVMLGDVVPGSFEEGG